MLLKSAFHPKHDVSPILTQQLTKEVLFVRKIILCLLPNSSKLALWDCRTGQQPSVFDEFGNPERHYVASWE